MAYKDALIAELQMETVATRKMLERIPTEKNDWAPHDKSMKLGKLAVHVADLPNWITYTMNEDGLDLATMNYVQPMPNSADELVATLNKNVENAVAALEHSSDEDFDKMWTLRRGDHVMFTLPKKVVLRSFAYSHQYHHRGQLSVYLRLLDVSIPGMYGPSFDDMAEMKAASAAASN